jgi:hypothetical protein
VRIGMAAARKSLIGHALPLDKYLSMLYFGELP